MPIAFRRCWKNKFTEVLVFHGKGAHTIHETGYYISHKYLYLHFSG